MDMPSEKNVDGTVIRITVGERLQTRRARLAEGGNMKKRKRKYDSELPRKMYTYFTGFQDAGAPSFDKFARSLGITLEELTAYRRNKEFDRAYRECGEIRRDYLIDTALTKRHDPSFVKFLLTVEFGMGEEEKGVTDGTLNLRLEVVE